MFSKQFASLLKDRIVSFLFCFNSKVEVKFDTFVFSAPRKMISSLFSQRLFRSHTYELGCNDSVFSFIIPQLRVNCKGVSGGGGQGQGDQKSSQK